MTNIILANYLLAIVLGVLSSTLAGVLSSDKFPSYVNELITLTFVLVCATADIIVTGQFTGDYSVFFGLLPAAITTVLPWLSPLRRWTGYLQTAINLYGAMTPNGPKSPPPAPPHTDIPPAQPTSVLPVIERDATTMPPALHPDWYKEPNPKEGTTRFPTAQLSSTLLPPIDLAHESIGRETRPVSSIDLLRLHLPTGGENGPTSLV